ncbi:MAG: 30S ribosomal protein S13 [Simkaniaceae bacterium]|nr:30S ribosomal protein S13 [Simkaniaceae bacterium]
MPRVIGIDIPDKKRLEIALTYIYGVGRNNVKEILEKLGLSPDMKAGDLTEADISKINAMLTADYVVEGDLRRAVQGNIKRLMSIGTYRGLRHRQKLPVRGQNTQTNARTRKGKKKTVANKKKAV